jgi:hypothetical protein
VLFTLALLLPIPNVLRLILSLAGPVAPSGYAFDTVIYLMAAFGLASLANIVVGLIVIWVGYIRGRRWAWYIMFVIAWVWFFPVFVLPYLPHLKSLVPITQLLSGAIREGGLARGLLEGFATIALMVLGLVLPIRTFVMGRAGNQASGAEVMPNRS